MNDKQKTILGRILIIIGLTILVIGFIYSLFIFNDNQMEIKKVDCFDRYGNKIIGEICEKETYNQDFTSYVILISFCWSIPFFIGWEILDSRSWII